LRINTLTSSDLFEGYFQDFIFSKFD